VLGLGTAARVNIEEAKGEQEFVGTVVVGARQGVSVSFEGY
jgi:hypothetical protein